MNSVFYNRRVRRDTKLIELSNEEVTTFDQGIMINLVVVPEAPATSTMTTDVAATAAETTSGGL